jgi:hypothetical protein
MPSRPCQVGGFLSIVCSHNDFGRMSRHAVPFVLNSMEPFSSLTEPAGE